MPNMSFKSYSKDGAAEAKAAQVEEEPAPKQGCVLLPEPAPWLRWRHPLLIVSPRTGDAALVFPSFMGAINMQPGRCTRPAIQTPSLPCTQEDTDCEAAAWRGGRWSGSLCTAAWAALSIHAHNEIAASWPAGLRQTSLQWLQQSRRAAMMLTFRKYRGRELHRKSGASCCLRFDVDPKV